ncbi:SubName: Full=Uncharacterized protein {ECO:0000313/EMBL:CCA67875.1} [Serendipita indica DSM 11827]|uniref:Uncharacterized protein n=1 Tax=Serendipita indica (strain DSM 11827) TaxID=1109443 RepID=G4T968_SERID|nr:SubName: Full=Uncharacterized protein {ECO:0000313/EMBL:CCA67875.1} [Serendipita indica DSM 11827]CCA67875.1 hypothetical protein PIIN_01699 [Serendipita indica DSM 11827]
MSSNTGIITGIYSSALSITDNDWVEQLTTDIPFLTIGIVALAALTLLLTTTRLSIPAVCIILSAFLAFSGAIFDFSRLLQEAKSSPPPQSDDTSTPRQFPLVVLREVNLALSISLNYFFFFVYLGRPPRGEARLVEFSPLSPSKRMSPSRWAYWGVTGYLLQAILAASIIAVAVLGIIWRIGGRAAGLVYKADHLLEAILALAFLGKVCLNVFLSPLTPRWKTARNYLPVIYALSTRLGIVITSEFCAGFTEAPLGRFLQAIQLYVLIVLIMVSPYYGKNEDEDSTRPVPRPEEKRASSFRGLRFSTTSQWSMLNPNPGTTEKPAMPPPPVTLPTTEGPKRLSPTKRLSSWLTNRLTPSGAGVTSNADGQLDRLWNKDANRSGDLEAPPTPIGIAVGGTDDDGVSPRPEGETPMMASWRDPYGVPNPLTTPETASFAIPPTPFSTADTDDRSVYATTPVTGSEKIPPVPLPTRSQLMALPPPPRGLPPPPPTQQTLPLNGKSAMKRDEKRRVSGLSETDKVQIPSGKFIGQFEVRKDYDSDSDSPIYGINGIIQRKESRMKKEEKKRISAFLEASTASALERLKREQEELDKSMQGMAAFSPSRNVFTSPAKPDAPKGDKSPTKLSSTSGDQDVLGNSFRPSYNSAPISESVKSDFSLQDFPSPPASLFRAPASTAPPTIELMPPPPAVTQPLSIKSSRSKAKGTAGTEKGESTPSSYESGDVVVEDVQFAMVPPRRPIASTAFRRASFPTVVRDSSISSLIDAPMRIISGYAESEDDVGAKRVRMSSTGNRLDVTSFIGELTTPGVTSPGPRSFLPSRDRGDSMASRLSPLPEDTSRHPSVEIIDIRMKSPTFSPAIAITTKGGSTATIPSNPPPRTPKVSFAEAANNPPSSSRLKVMKPPSPTNTLPASPRPGGNSPNESPRRQVAFKPATSSPLATSPGFIVPASSTASPTAGSPTTRRLKATYPGLGANGAKPVISGPFPLGTGGGMREDGTEYQAPRRPPQVRTARFL